MQHPSKTLSILLGAALFLEVGITCLAQPVPPAAANRPVQVLIVTGIDHPAHKWRETAPALRDLLERDQRVGARIVEDPGFLGSDAITNYQVVLLHFQNWQAPGPGVSARENLLRYVRNGGGLVSVHFACGAWHGEWPEFIDLIGRVWFGAKGGRQHDPRGPFKVKIVDKDHPVTKGISDFETEDELYTCLTGDKPIHLLAEATSKVEHKDHPMAFVRDYGKGRVFLTTLGHDVKGLTNSVVPLLLQQGCVWAAAK
jgi:hypothetical protein